MEIRPYVEADRAWAERLLNDEFGGPLQARRGELIDVLALPGFIAEENERPVGLLTYRRETAACELAFLAAVEQRQGIGSALLDEWRRELEDCERTWVVTTNDNLDAIRFYQRRGFVLSALRAGAIDEARRTLKPTISIVGNFGIPIRDEIELELVSERDREQP
jgi:ribosomal protein S18 acetylase RimI-like enzyme